MSQTKRLTENDFKFQITRRNWTSDEWLVYCVVEGKEKAEQFRNDLKTILANACNTDTQESQS